MTVHIPSTLRSYTKQKRALEAEGYTVAEMLSGLDRHYPGLRFRIVTAQDTIRPHIRFFFNDRQISTLAGTVTRDDRVYIICTLSGG